MRTTRIKINNLFGVKEIELDGRDVELTGANGAGKSSVLDAIRYALTNQSERDYIIRQGEKEGDILIEAGTALRIDRRKRTEQADYKSVKQEGREVGGAEGFLRSVFTPMQLDPVAFVQMTKKEQNRLLLDLVEFKWDLNWIREQFGEIPEKVDYSQNILQVLNDIQSENGEYFQRRQELNRDIRNKKAFVEDIAGGIPQGYDAEKWEAFDLGEAYQRIERIANENNRIERARLFLAGVDGKKRSIEADYLARVTGEEKRTANEREQISAEIARLEEQIKALKDRQDALDDVLEDRKRLFAAEKNEALAKLGGDMQTAEEWAGKTVVDLTEQQEKVALANQMKRHLREYARMKAMQQELAGLQEQSQALTDKIELARTLPGEILRTASLPVEGLTVEDGVPLINGLPVSNLSDGEKLNLCVDVTLAKPNALQIILIDGAEKLSDKNREALYARCKEHGLQFIATRTDNSEELTINYL